MKRLIIAIWSCTLVSSATHFAIADEPPTQTPDAAASDSVFALTKLWPVHLKLTAENWKAMEPAGGGFPGFGPPPGSAPGRDAGNSNPPRNNRPPQFRPGSFGYEFDYVKANVEFGDATAEDIGLRYKGNGTYMMSAAGRKRSFKLDFDEYIDDQTVLGLKRINLHNNVMEPTHLRQVLAYAVFAEAGIPTPRTAFAEVTLTVDGEIDGEYLGLYTVVEEVDKAFLKRHFQNVDGMLLKPEGVQGLEYKGEDWADYAWYEPKSEPKKKEQQRLIELTRLIHKADDDKFRSEIGNYLDLDQFVRFLAGNALLSNMDSFLTQVHNYYIYLDPESNRFVFLPWDTDLAFGNFFFVGTVEQLMDLSIAHPHVGENRVIDRLMEWDEFTTNYRQRLEELNTACFADSGSTIKHLALLERDLAKVLARESNRANEEAKQRPAFGPFGPGGGNPFNGPITLKDFTTGRFKSVRSQLAGESDGYTPASMSFGPPPGR